MIIRPVYVAGYWTNRQHAVLLIIVLRELEPQYFCKRITFVCRFQRPRQQVFFFHGLGALSRIDARASEKQRLANSILLASFKQIQLYSRVLAQESNGIALIGGNSTHFGRDHQDYLGAMNAKVLVHLSLIGKIQFIVARCHQLNFCPILKKAMNSRANHS